MLRAFIYALLIVIAIMVNFLAVPLMISAANGIIVLEGVAFVIVSILVIAWLFKRFLFSLPRATRRVVEDAERLDNQFRHELQNRRNYRR